MDTISDVVSALDRIIAVERERGSRRGYFPCMYRATTRKVGTALRQGRFHDPARMEALDIRFADYYLQAWRQAGVGQPCSGPWRVAFRATRSPDLLIVQHLLLGMNAHINFDLALAVVEVGGDELERMWEDFNTINDILGEQLDEVQEALGLQSPPMARVDTAGGRWDERLFHFSLSRARDVSWAQARAVASLPHSARPTAARLIEDQATGVARVMAGVRLPALRAEEPDRDRASIVAVIDALRALA